MDGWTPKAWEIYRFGGLLEKEKLMDFVVVVFGSREGSFTFFFSLSLSLFVFFFARRFSEMVNSLRTSLILVGLWILGKGVGFGLVGWVG